MLRVWRVPFSTNVERVALAARLKGVEVDWVDVDPTDRSPIRALTGQDLVPVARFGDETELVTDSVAILRRLEAEHPAPPLWPGDEALRARAEVLVEWFNAVWKGPPNALADGTSADPAADAARLRGWTAWFEGLLAGGPHLLGTPEPTVADVVAWPFLRYGADIDPADPDPFHRVLHEHLHPLPPRLAAWASRLGRC